MALGAPGGTRIFAAAWQAIVNVIDHGMTLQEAVEVPCIRTQGQALEVEPGIAPAVRHELTIRGHDVQVVPKIAGGMNGIMLTMPPVVLTCRLLARRRFPCRVKRWSGKARAARFQPLGFDGSYHISLFICVADVTHDSRDTPQ